MDRVLVAEDSPEIAKLMELTLRMEGYEVLQAFDGLQALELARNERPDLILLDVMMPGLNGFEVAQELKKDAETADIPIIFVTAKHELDALVQGLEVAVDYISKPFAVPELAARVRAAMRMRKLQEDLKTSNEELSRLAITDALTGLLNRRGFAVQLDDELWRARRFGHTIGFVLFDLDRFKSVNDTWGHAQGDVVLQNFADILTKSSRRVDKVARFGGEEFALLLPSTDQNGVETVCEKVRAATEAMRVPLSVGENGGQSIRITVSGGGIIVPRIGENGVAMPQLAQGIFEIADRCLYSAKAGGRNRVITQILSDVETAKIGAEVPPAPGNLSLLKDSIPEVPASNAQP
ncbi:response regulator receiver modulated diguanylate cyclase [Abditibacterium utsteinense]|uniref:diguanylate cyclase n=1 Tax=Abditibacterium utsteinense TaxID=1960156 RepID=A0A2S8SUS5_9BACT|nr:diguanylate cyclase [Abditibacterium utsteinense]PQV64545.1 response regulator receiver modulated diguanylate cyclase [Abditibacterium utsteinense]